MGAKVMVVDDSGLSRRMLRRILEEGGHAVVEEKDGASALERYALDKPAVVMLDLVMAGMYGLDVLTALRSLDAEARVIIASADIQRATRDEALAAGAHAFVGKPFMADEVLAAVGTALAQAQKDAPR